MYAENDCLGHLLSELLGAVSQQFFHILLLRRHSETELARRFVEVDDEDFKNAMAIIDLLVRRNVPILIEPHHVSPGLETSDILRMEFAMERHMQNILDGMHVDSVEARAIVDRATILRADYRTWLENEISTRQKEQREVATQVDEHHPASLLMQLMEQALVHAFQNWHAGKTNDADTAWQTSGAAMIYLTALAPYVAKHVENGRRITIQHPRDISAANGFSNDMRLAEQCSAAAAKAAKETNDQSLSALYHRIAVDCENLAKTTRGSAINATFGTSKTFTHFESTRDRMLST